MTIRTIRLIVVDDDPLVRAGLALMLGGADDIEIVGEAADGAAVPALVDRLAPRRRPHGHPHARRRRPHRHGSGCGPSPPPRRHRPSPPSTPTSRCCGRCGPAQPGSSSSDTPPAQIVDAVRKVAAGDPVLSPAVTRQLMTHVAAAVPRRARHRRRGDDPGATAPRPGSRRSPNGSARSPSPSRHVGRSNAEIATALYMSVPTVKAHVSRILGKLGLNNRVQIALLVHDAGPPGGRGTALEREGAARERRPRRRAGGVRRPPGAWQARPPPRSPGGLPGDDGLPPGNDGMLGDTGLPARERRHARQVPLAGRHFEDTT